MTHSLPLISRVKESFIKGNQMNQSTLLIIFDMCPIKLQKNDMIIIINGTCLKIDEIYSNYAIRCFSKYFNDADGGIFDICLRSILNGSESNHYVYTKKLTSRKRSMNATDEINQDGVIAPNKKKYNKLPSCVLSKTIQNAKRIITNEHIDEDNKWLKLMHLVNEYNWLHNKQQTAFHDAILSENAYILSTFKELLKPPHNHYLSTVKTGRGENLLHFACLHGKLDIVRDLICAPTPAMLYDQDSSGNTALHIALNLEDRACIQLFCELLKKALSLTQSVSKHQVQAIKRMINSYNYANKTVLHLAIIGKHLHLTEYLLQFCAFVDINVVAMRILCTGTSIYELAVNTKSAEMYALVVKHVPNMENCIDLEKINND